MPSGRIHDKIAIFSTIPVFISGVFLFKFNFIAGIFFTFSSLFSQLMFGPDLDSKSSQYKRWGLLRWVWFPYRKIFRHRSSFSHGLIWGPILRCIYLTLFASICFITLSFYLENHFRIEILSNFLYFLKYISGYFYILKIYFISVISGFFVGAAIHTLTDKVTSFFNNLL